MYVLDVTRLIPYFGVFAGGAALNGGTIERTRLLPDVGFALGVDYKFTPKWAAGIAIRQHMFFTDTSDYPTYTTALLRFEYTWGF
jgi:hypothetical protein